MPDSPPCPSPFMALAIRSCSERPGDFIARPRCPPIHAKGFACGRNQLRFGNSSKTPAYHTITKSSQPATAKMTKAVSGNLDVSAASFEKYQHDDNLTPAGNG